jgi:hypothetical protein
MSAARAVRPEAQPTPEFTAPGSWTTFRFAPHAQESRAPDLGAPTLCPERRTAFGLHGTGLSTLLEVPALVEPLAP